MKEYPEYARPRERMEMLGAEQLSDQELLAILLATGSKEYSALDLAERLLQSHKGLPGLRELSLDELMEQKGKYYELFLVQSKYYGEGGAADVD